MSPRHREALALAGVAALTLGLGALLSRATTAVVNWFVMTDELLYARLAISIARTGSLLPRLHGDVVSNVNHLYPFLLSPLFGQADVPASLVAAHRLNAFLMVSAAIPVYLLARWLGVGRLLAAGTGAAAAAVPWVVLSSFLLSEVVAYPAFCWALLALAYAVGRKTNWADALALAAIALAVSARTQFVLLAGLLPLAVAAESLLASAGAGRRGRALVRDAALHLVRRRRLLVGAYALALLVVVAAAVAGGVDRLLGRYATTASGVRLDRELLELTLQHGAAIALGLAILPFLLATAWLVDRLAPSAPPRERAFALVQAGTLVLLTLQVASFDQRFGGGLVKDRYLFYVVPGLLVALAACLSSRRQPRWWTVLVPAVPCVLGLGLLQLPTYEKLNVDSVLATVNDGLLELSGSPTPARASLVAAAVVAVQLLTLGRLLVPARALAAGAAVLVALALPAQTAYAFERLFRVNGTNGLPVTLDQGVVFNWVDRALAGDDDTTMFRYPILGGDYWAGVAYWWDLEFWNESVTRNPELGGPGEEPWARVFDERTGAVRGLDHTSYAVFHETEVRFRLAGRHIHSERGATIVEPATPWRASFVTYGIHGDGWTRPDTGARIRVFAAPGQETALRRSVSILLVGPDEADRPVTVASNVGEPQQLAVSAASAQPSVEVCVPPGGFGEIRLEAPEATLIGQDPSVGQPTGATDRPVGVLIRGLGLADEAVPLERCP